MYDNALRQKENLKLSPLEIFETKSHMLVYLLIAGIGFLSILLAALGLPFINLAGFIYIIIGPSVSLLYKFRNKKKKKLFNP